VIVSEEGRLMTSKERVMTAVALSRPDRVPMDFNANPATMKRLMEDLDASSLRELLLQLHNTIFQLLVFYACFLKSCFITFYETTSYVKIDNP